MNILILGGTGAIGKELVKILLQSDLKIYVTTRQNLKSKNNVNYIQGDAHNMDFLENILKQNKFDSIIDFMIYNHIEFRKRIDLFLNNTSQYVFMSSATVYSGRDELINEKTDRLLDSCKDKKFINSNAYPLEKAKEENILLECKKKNWTIIRPYITYNDNRLQLGKFEKEQWLHSVLVGKKIFLQRELLNKKTSLTYAGDVAKYISYLILNEKAYGKVIQIASNNSTTTWQDIFNIYTNECRKKGINIDIEFVEGKKYDKLMPEYYGLKYDRYYNRVFDSKKLEEIIGKKVIYREITDGLSKCICSYLDKVDTSKINIEPTYTAIADRITHTHTKLKDFSSLKNKIKYILARYTQFYNLKRNIL